ncbi:hypothetical protein PENTCL1PPCAC_987, partial [Pristionchus entomophagus]
MIATRLPSELWERLLSFCDHPSACALAKVCQRLASIATATHERVLEKCLSEGITLPSSAILALSQGCDDLSLEARFLMAHNPFGGHNLA